LLDFIKEFFMHWFIYELSVIENGFFASIPAIIVGSIKYSQN